MKLKLTLFAAAMLFVAAGILAAVPEAAKLKFVVMTDIHFGRSDAVEKVSNSLDVLLRRAVAADALFVTGDLTDGGHQRQYDQMKEVFDGHVPASTPCYYVMGNHDRYNDKSIDDSRFSRTFGQPADTTVAINGYYFIMLSMRYHSGKDIYDRDFLSRSLAAAQAADPSKPIFLMYHVPTDSTVYGSYAIGGRDNWGTGVVKDILSQYPSVFAFSGHSHYPLRDERSIHQGAFTSVNAGTNAYAEYERGKTDSFHPAGYLDVTEGLVVEVFADGRVVMTRYDTRRDEQIREPWTVEPPYPGKRQLDPSRIRPDFPRGAEVEVKDEEDGIRVGFPQAWAGDGDPHHYRIVLFDHRGDAVPGRTYTVFSGFHLGSAMPAEIDAEMKGLQPGRYSIMVTAVDSFGNYSKPLMSRRIRIR